MSRRRQWHSTPVLLPGKSHGLTLVRPGAGRAPEVAVRTVRWPVTAQPEGQQADATTRRRRGHRRARSPDPICFKSHSFRNLAPHLPPPLLGSVCPVPPRDPLKPARPPRDSRKQQQKHQLGPMCHKVRTHGGREPRSPDCPGAPCHPGAPSLPPGPPQPGLSGRRVQNRVLTYSSCRRADPTCQLRAGSGHQPGRNRLGKSEQDEQKPQHFRVYS